MSAAVPAQVLPTVSIAGVEITTDTEGRFNLNALHKASGEPDSKKPSEWLRGKQAQELVDQLEAENPAIKTINVIKGRGVTGTFAHELIAVSYAGWISPLFQLKVNQTFLDVRSGKLALKEVPLPQKLKAVGDVMQGFSRLAGLLGLRGNQRALSAAMATHRETGVNVLELTGVTHLKADVAEQFINSTSLGERTDPTKTANEINLLLEQMGLQAAHRVPGKRPGKMRIAYWDLTDAGRKAGGDIFDTGKRDHQGRPVKQIMWPTSVIALVQVQMECVAA